MGIRMLTINVNGYDIQAKYREEDIKTVFMPFLQHVIQLQKDVYKRQLLFLLAPLLYQPLSSTINRARHFLFSTSTGIPAIFSRQLYIEIMI